LSRNGLLSAAGTDLTSLPKVVCIIQVKKLVWDAEATDFQDPEKGGWEPVGPAGRKTLPGSLDWRQTGIYSQLPGGQTTNSGY
jgi:hypothetical protein